MKQDSPSRATKKLSIRLDDDALTAILDNLDRAASENAVEHQGADRRYSYRHRTLLVELAVAGGEPRAFRVASRDLGKGGLAFLHGGYVHAGTRCRAHLVTIHNHWQIVEGTVVRCQYIQGRVHEIGVRFDRPIDVATFASNAVSRHVLIVDDETSSLRLLAHHLGQMNARVAMAKNGEEAIEKAGSRLFDLILLEIEMPVMDGLTAVRRLRQNGYRGVIVAATGLTCPDDRERLLQAGFSGYIAKPITKQGLKHLLNGLDDEPLFSALAGEAGMDDLINQFVADLAGRVRALEEAAAAGDHSLLERLARVLKGEAGGYGFEPIIVAARDLEGAAKAVAETTELEEKVTELIHLCRLARPITD
jgi:CheY-like chemotaxis protein